VENFLTDNSDILFQFKHLDLSRVIELRENNFADVGLFPEAPVDVEDALDNYERVLEIVGEIAGDFVAPRSVDIDIQGATFHDGEVFYAPGTVESIDRMKKSDLMGFTLPRRYGGLNMPKTIYTIAIEMISRADASLMNVFGLQEIADTIYRFGNEDQRQRFLPRLASGEAMGAMDLTEPDAGSDLQAVMLRAYEKEGEWYLNGSKRFITNGCADISLVMARSEEGLSGGRGISLFIYDRDETMRVRRIEHKLGIKGSPTCELQFNDAPAELLGQRKMGLVKYTMALMNGARLAVAAQALGIAEAAWREANKYSIEREQFKKQIREFPAVYEMLTEMKIGIETGRSLLYETARLVDIKEGIEDLIEREPERRAELRAENSLYTKLAALFTPLAKAYNAEMANKVCYDAIQIHGGVGFTTEFKVERHYRDARITNIYEGTTQLQVVAAIGGVISGVVDNYLDLFLEENDLTPAGELFEKATALREKLNQAISAVRETGERDFQEYHAGRLVNSAIDVIIAHLLCRDAIRSERKRVLAKVFMAKATQRVKTRLSYISSKDRLWIDDHKQIIDQEQPL
jgi:alkylation response protein AidB-like acyl-CoA dehydrogenase